MYAIQNIKINNFIVNTNNPFFIYLRHPILESQEENMKSGYLISKQHGIRIQTVFSKIEIYVLID